MRLEDAAVAGERRDALLQARTRRLDEADDRDSGAPCLLEHAADRVGLRLAERATEV